MIVEGIPKNCIECPLRQTMLIFEEEYASGCKNTGIIVEDYMDERPSFCPFGGLTNEID